MHLTMRQTRETGRDYALRTLKENITCLELAPGSMVSENELATELGLSRTPVREALIELSKVKIVEIYPQKGSGVALIDYQLVEESQFMRNVLECSVAELNCSMASSEDLRRLNETVNLYSFYAGTHDPDTILLQLDDQFHQTMFDIAQKPQVYTLMKNIAIHFDRVRSLTLTAATAQNVVQEHQAIVDAISARDAAGARQCMERHLNSYRVEERFIRDKYPHFFKT